MTSGNMYLSAGGKTIGIRFGFHALMGMTGDQIFDENSVSGNGQKAFINAVTVTKMAWLGYQTHCMYMEQMPEMNFQQFFDFMEDVYLEQPNTLADIWTLFIESQKRAKPVNDDKEKKSLKQKK